MEKDTDQFIRGLIEWSPAQAGARMHMGHIEIESPQDVNVPVAVAATTRTYIQKASLPCQSGSSRATRVIKEDTTIERDDVDAAA